MGLRTLCVLAAITLTCNSIDGKYVPLRQVVNSPPKPFASTNTTLVNGLYAFAETLVQELQSTNDELRAALTEISAMKKNAALTSAMQISMSVRISQAEAGLETTKLNVIRCPAKQRGPDRPVPGGKVCLSLQAYMSLILYETSTFRTLWRSNGGVSNLRSSCDTKLIMQGDGNLCMYTISATSSDALWCATGESGAVLAFESDGHLCLKNPKGQSCKWTSRQ